MTVDAGLDQGTTVEPPVGGSPEGTVDDSNSLANSFLKDVPENERPIVEKYVKNWDAGVTKRFQEVHSEYEDFKPFKEAGVDSETLSQAYALVQALEADPQGTVKAIAEAYGISFQEAAQVAQALTPEQGQQPQQVGTPGDLDPRIAQIEQLATTTAQLIMQQEEQRQAALADQQLDQLLNSMHEKHGDFNEKQVLLMAQQTGDLEGAVQEYKTWEQQILTAGNRPAPVVLGAGGGLPSSDINPAQLNSKETKALVTQLLQKAQQENQ